jgi:hypothetical protein
MASAFLAAAAAAYPPDRTRAAALSARDLEYQHLPTSRWAQRIATFPKGMWSSNQEIIRYRRPRNHTNPDTPKTPMVKSRRELGSGVLTAARRPFDSLLRPVVKYRIPGSPPLPPLPKVSAQGPWKLLSLITGPRNAPDTGSKALIPPAAKLKFPTRSALPKPSKLAGAKVSPQGEASLLPLIRINSILLSH